MSKQLTIAALTLATAGLSSTQAIAIEPVSVNEVMVYMSFSLDRRGDSGRAGRVGLRFGQAVTGNWGPVDPDPRVVDAVPDHLDLRFQRAEEGGVLVNGMSLQRRRDLPLLDQPDKQRAVPSKARSQL